jgi:hypothetical protein
MGVENMLELTYRGNKLGEKVDDFGQLRPSNDILGNGIALRERMIEDGYLYLPGLLDKDESLEARREIMGRLDTMGAVDDQYPLMEGVYKPGNRTGGMNDLTKNNPSLMQVLYSGPMIRFYETFLDGPVAHFDYTWFRVKTPGVASPTTPHCDIVYMGRGTTNLYTSWTPLGDVPYEMGGLMLLENSHRNEHLRNSYGQTDVDKYCNDEEAEQIVEAARVENRDLSPEERAKLQWNSTGAYSSDAISTRSELGGRWLTTDYELGDLLVFCMYMIHASSDNLTNRIRISSDSRYQLAEEEQDPRWIGADPPAHGILAKKGMVC